ncbi:MAG: hypothetical protein CME06_09220 [Gemmatimonadetes bacterium]|nr:hypothetical protein [Gemmatimonadota bacterium]
MSIVALAFALLVAATAAKSTVAFNCGSPDGYEVNDGIYYAPDQPYTPGSGGGHIGGDSLSWEGLGLHHDWGWVEHRLYKTVRTGDHSYMFETTPGMHELTLRWVDAESNGPEGRIVEARIDGRTVVSNLDIYKEVGKSRSLDIRRVVSVTDTTTLVEIIGLKGGSTLAGIALVPFVPNDPLPAPFGLNVRPTYGGALLTWYVATQVNLAGYRVPLLDHGRHAALLRDRYAPFAVVPGDSTATLLVQALDSRGRPSAAATLRNLGALPLPGSSPLRLAQLYVDPEDLRELEATLPQKVRRSADLWVDGIRRTGEVNFRGYNALELPKKSYKFRIDVGLDVNGSDVVSLSANFVDRTLAKETLSNEILAAIGHPAYQTSPWRLMLNDAYAGIFNYVEEPDEIYLERIGLDPHGRCYKATQICANADRVDDYIQRYENTNADDLYRRDIIRLMHELDATSDGDFEEWVRGTFDLDQVLNWYSGQIFIGNHDYLCNNQMLYRDRAGGPWKMLAWDMDNVFHDVADPANYGNREHPNDTGQWSLLIDRMLSVPSLMRRHLVHLEESLDGPLATTQVLDMFDQLMTTIIPDAEIDVAKYTREHNVRFHNSVDDLREFLEERETYLRASIDELMPPLWVDLTINEIANHEVSEAANDAATRGSVELHYRGVQPLSATGFYLSNDTDLPQKWPIPAHNFTEDEILALDLPERLERGSWVGLTVATPEDTFVVDSLRVFGSPGDPSIGRFPDGYGRVRVLLEETLGSPNLWSDPVTVVPTTVKEIFDEGEDVWVDLLVVNNWRSSINVDLEVDVVGPGGVWWFDEPVDIVPIQRLAAGDSVTKSWRGKIPVNFLPENAGRYDLVFTPIERRAGPRMASGTATIYALGDPLGSLLINEFCASNSSIIADEQGEFEDWIEIVNPADSVISTANLYLSDDLDDDPFEWALPLLDMSPGEHLLIWLDNEPAEGLLHATFKLDRDGEEIGFVRSVADSAVVLERIPFSYQDGDWSFGRYPDSAPNWELFDTPTPAATNAGPVLRY